MPEEPEIIEEEPEVPEEEPEYSVFTGYRVLIYDRGDETPSWQVLLDTSSGENPGIVKASVETKLNEPGSFSYSIVPTHPLYDKTEPMRVYVSVREGTYEIFYGRVLSVQTNPLTQVKAVTCEGALAFLLDAELPIDTEDREMTAVNYFKYCINQYNSATKIDNNTYDELRRLRAGTINVDDASETHTYKNESYTQIQSVMKSQLLNVHDGFFHVRSVAGSTTSSPFLHYIDWKKQIGSDKSYSIKPGLNVIDQTNTLSGEDFFTIMRPVGNNDLTLSSNNGLINISSSMINKYGKIIRTVNFDADSESELQTKANKYKNKLVDNRLTITGDITFVDFAFLLASGETLSIHIGDRIGLYKDLDYIVGYVTVESLTRDLLDPSKDKMSLKNDKDLMNSARASGANGSNNSGVKASTKISSGGGSRGGGGGGPSQYIKSATLSTDGKTLTLTPAHGTPIDFSKATTLEGAWSSGTLTVSAYQTNKGIKSNVGTFVSDHLLALARGGSEISEAFRAELRTVDTGEDVIYPNLRISKDIYLYENVNGTNSNVVAGGNADGSNPVASISVRSTYYAGKASVELNDPTWGPATTTSGTYVESNTAKVRTSGRAHGTVQEQEKEVKVFLTKGATWTNNKLTVFLHSGTIDGPVQAATEVDASSIRYAGKASVELTDPSWNPTSNPIPSSQKITVTTVNRTDASGHSEEITKEALVFLTQGTWSNNKLKVYLKSGSTEGTTRAETEVDASELVSATATEARRAGKYSVTLTDPAWNPTGSTYPESQKIAVTTVNRTDLSGNPAEITKETPVFLTQGTWSDSRLTVYLKSESAEGTIRAATTIDATTLVLNARCAGKASVGLNDLTWTPTSSPLPESQTITARTTNRTTSSGTPADIVKQLSLNLVKGTTWTDNKLNVTLKAGSGSTPIAETTVDASELVSNARTDGINTGKASVGLNDLTWTPTSNPLPESQTITARTSGRTTSTLLEIEKTLALSLVKGTTWSDDNKLSVTLKAGSGSTPIAATEVDASSVFYAGKASVGLTNVAWQFDPSYILNYNRFTVKTSGRTDSTGAIDEATVRETLYLVQGEWDSRDMVDVTLRKGTSSGDAYARITVDASSLVTAAEAAATLAGKKSVTLEDPVWTDAPTSGSLGTSCNIRVSTSGRTGTGIDNLDKNVGMSLSKSGLTVYMKWGNTQVATITCSDSDLKAANIKKDVEIFGVTGTLEIPSLQTNRTATYTTNGEKELKPSSVSYDGMKKATITVKVPVVLPASVTTSSSTGDYDKEYSVSKGNNFIRIKVAAGTGDDADEKTIQIKLLSA